MNPDSSSSRADPWALARRGCLCAFAVVAAGTGLVWSTGLLPEQSLSYIFSAILVASLTCAIGIFIKAMVLRSDGSKAKPSLIIHVAVLGDFVMQIFVLGMILLAMHFSGVKFASSASFALAFAAVVFVFPLVATLILVKGLGQRVQSAGAKSEASAVEHGKHVTDLTSS